MKQYSSRWERARKAHLARYPLCVICLSYGVVEPARVVDHKTPHKGNQRLFWDRSNWQSLCFNHHNSDAKRMEAGGKIKKPVGVDGWSVDDPVLVTELYRQKNPRGGEF